MGAIVLAPSAAIGALLLGTLFYAKRIRRRKLRTRNPDAYKAHRSGDTGSVKIRLDDEPRKKRESEAISVISLSPVQEGFSLPEHRRRSRRSRHISHGGGERSSQAPRTSDDDRAMMRSMLGVVPEVEEEEEEKDDDDDEEHAANVHRRSPPGRSGMHSAEHVPPVPQIPSMHQMPQAPPMHQMPQAPPMPHMQGMPPMAPLPGMPPNAYMADPSMQMVPMHPAYAPMVYPMQMQMHAMQQREADLAKREAEMSQWMSTRQQRRSTYVSQDTRPPGGAPPAASPYEDIFKEQGGNPDKPDELPPSYNLSEQIKKREEISAMRQNER